MHKPLYILSTTQTNMLLAQNPQYKYRYKNQKDSETSDKIEVKLSEPRIGKGKKWRLTIKNDILS